MRWPTSFLTRNLPIIGGDNSLSRFPSGRNPTVRMFARYAGSALVATVLIVLALAPYASSLVEQWSRHDVELRSRLIFNSVRHSLTELLAANDKAGIEDLFARVENDDRVLGLGFCVDPGVLRFQTKLLPSTFSCKKAARSETASFSSLTDEGAHLIAATFPIAVRNTKGHLVILHDLSFATKRSAEARTFLTAALVGIVLVATLLATLGALAVVRRWMIGLRESLSSAALGHNLEEMTSRLGPIGEELRLALRKMDLNRVAPVDTERTDWTAETIREVMNGELANAQVIVVSNREPYIHNREADGIKLQIPASGLVSALEPVTRACGGTWIAHGSGSADHETADARGRIRVPPDNPGYTLRRVWISEQEQEGYYYSLANEGLWPLCHIAFVRPTFRAADWDTYRAINERFAKAVVDEATTDSPIVLVQDYHFALLPRMVRERLPKATIITFWHIPWPNSETFSIFPWKEEIVQGLLGSSIVGFHTQFHCNNFIETADRFIESRIDREHASITLSGRETFIRPYPISIEWPPAALGGQKPVAECRSAVRERLGIPAETHLAVGIERFDYTKGILDRMLAIDALLTAHPEWKGRFVFVQAAAPTRSKLPAYAALQAEAQRLAAEINDRHGVNGVAPVRLVIRHHDPTEVFELFRAADVCIVSSLHDGMNLVAKEFVASRDDEQGVLALSTFAGASRELSEALMVNPYDPHSMAVAIERALTMPRAEQRERMRLMRDLIRSRNVYRWAGQMLLDASRLRKKQYVLEIAALHQKGGKGRS